MKDARGGKSENSAEFLSFVLMEIHQNISNRLLPVNDTIQGNLIGFGVFLQHDRPQHLKNINEVNILRRQLSDPGTQDLQGQFQWFPLHRGRVAVEALLT